MKYNIGRKMGIGLALLTTTDIYAGNGFEIVTYSVVGSAGVQESDSWSIFSAVGQPIAGEDVMGGGFSITSGFPPNSDGELQCRPDLTNDGALNFLDISAFLSAFGNQLPIADLNSDGVYNFLDISSYLTLYSMGCP
tara:strand:+ start:2890 stop:3300 length:411 start_codon:yes stop_codon:yes gene_type:complete